MNNKDWAVRNIRYQIQEIPSEMKFLRFLVTFAIDVERAGYSHVCENVLLVIL